MSNESSVLTVTRDGPGAKLATGSVCLLNSSNLSHFTGTSAIGAFSPGGTWQVYYGAQVTRDTVRAEVGTAGSIGSLYLSSGGKVYMKVANANATADWQLVTATAAD